MKRSHQLAGAMTTHTEPATKTTRYAEASVKNTGKGECLRIPVGVKKDKIGAASGLLWLKHVNDAGEEHDPLRHENHRSKNFSCRGGGGTEQRHKGIY